MRNIDATNVVIPSQYLHRGCCCSRKYCSDEKTSITDKVEIDRLRVFIWSPHKKKSQYRISGCCCCLSLPMSFRRPYLLQQKNKILHTEWNFGSTSRAVSPHFADIVLERIRERKRERVREKRPPGGRGSLDMTILTRHASESLCSDLLL